MRETELREELLRSAVLLVEEGLIERTWGNLSVRVSETHFLITPSAMPYETLRSDQLVPVKIADGSWEGEIKPSSEKGIHAGVYRLRPDVGFVIHTHQRWASVAGIEGRALTGPLGERIPCAGYGLPGSRRLRRAVSAEVEAWKGCRAFLMRRHGALCLGRDRAEAFDVAGALEEICRERVRSAVELPVCPSVPDFGSSRRRGDAFVLRLNGEEHVYHIGDHHLPPAAALHGAIYQAGCFQYIAHETAPEVTAVSSGCKILRPYLDDLAQIAGADIRCVPPEPRLLPAALTGRNAVLLRGAGALCAGGVESDVDAVRSLLRKGCMALFYARTIPGCRPLGTVDARLQRAVYLQSYKKKSQRR